MAMRTGPSSPKTFARRRVQHNAIGAYTTEVPIRARDLRTPNRSRMLAADAVQHNALHSPDPQAQEPLVPITLGHAEPEVWPTHILKDRNLHVPFVYPDVSQMYLKSSVISEEYTSLYVPCHIIRTITQAINRQQVASSRELFEV